MFSEKFKKFIKQNYLLVLAFVFMYITPLIMLMILACQGKSTVISLKLWGTVVGFIMIIIYIAKFKKWVNDRKQFEKQEQLKIPIWLRIVQLVVSLIGFIVAILFLSVVKDMFQEIMIFTICCMVSVVIGHLFLIGDSKNRKSHKLTRN